MRRILPLIAMLAIAPFPAAQSAPQNSAKKAEKVQETKLPNGLVVHEYKLANGMQLLLVPDHSAPVFTYQVWFKVGSAQEKTDPRLQKTGLAHFFEHMMFRGTKAVPQGQFDIILGKNGAVGENATTWLDRTNYFESLPKEKLELAFRLESDRMANLVIDEKGFKTELGAVIGEYKMGKDKPARVASETLWDLAFTKHPYKYTVIGTLEELNSFTVEDAMYFYKTYYAPNNAALILIGDFEIPRALQLAQKYYGKYEPKVLVKHEMVAEPEQKEMRKREMTHPLANANYLTFGYKIPNAAHGDIAALELIGSILAVGNGSVLEQELVQTGLASSVSAGPYRTRYPSLFMIDIQMAPGKPDDKALGSISGALNRLRQGRVSAAEIERARNQYLLNAYNDLLDAGAIGRNLGESLVSTDSYLREFQIHEELKKVTADDLKRVANAYLIDEKLSFLRLTPEKGAAK